MVPLLAAPYHPVRGSLNLSNDGDNTHASNHSVMLGRLIGLLER